MLESSNGSTCDVRISDLVDSDNQDGYSKVGESSRRVFAFGKCAKTQNKGKSIFTRNKFSPSGIFPRILLGVKEKHFSGNPFITYLDFSSILKYKLILVGMSVINFGLNFVMNDQSSKVNFTNVNTVGEEHVILTDTKIIYNGSL